MIKVYFTRNDSEWSKDKLDQMMLPLPADMQHKIIAYKGWQERQSRILGKWMLMKLISDFGLGLRLADLKYTEYNKPYFDLLPPNPLKGALTAKDHIVLKPPLGDLGVFDFSIAHSGEIVICAGVMNAKIGVDIEKIVPLDLSDYEDQLTPDEWKLIHDAPDRMKAFYQIWTKKEALLKTLGRGIDMDFKELDVSSDKMVYEGTTYWFCPVSIAENYIAHLASTAYYEIGSISAEMVNFD